MPIVPVDSLLDDNKHVSLNIHLLVYFSWNRCFAIPATRVSRHSRIQDSEVFPFNWVVLTIHVRCIWTIYINKITHIILLFFIKLFSIFTFSTLVCWASKQILYLALYWIFKTAFPIYRVFTLRVNTTVIFYNVLKPNQRRAPSGKCQQSCLFTMPWN